MIEEIEHAFLSANRGLVRLPNYLQRDLDATNILLGMVFDSIANPASGFLQHANTLRPSSRSLDDYRQIGQAGCQASRTVFDTTQASCWPL